MPWNAKKTEAARWRVGSEASGSDLDSAGVTEIAGDGWTGRFERMSFGGGLQMHLGRVEVNKDAEIVVKGSGSDALISAYCWLTGKGMLHMCDVPPIPLAVGTTLLFRARDRIGRFVLPGKQVTRFFSIAFAPPTLLSLLDGVLPPMLAPFQQPPEAGTVVLRSRLSPAMRRQIASLGDPTSAGPLERLRREGASLDLVAEVISGLERRRHVPNAWRLSARETQQIARARALLSADLSRPPSLAAVAETVGLTLNRLLDGFRALYGDTPAQIMRRERLEHARMLLEREDVPLKEIAARIGYRHMTNFVTAFTAHFGAPPRRLVRSARG